MVRYTPDPDTKGTAWPDLACCGIEIPVTYGSIDTYSTFPSYNVHTMLKRESANTLAWLRWMVVSGVGMRRRLPMSDIIAV